MSVILELADETVHQMAKEVLTLHHPELRLPDGHVKLCIMMASSDREDGEPPVKNQGYPCYAVISVIPYKQRVDKRADAEIIIDKDRWVNDLTEPQQRALLDHEITHLEIQTDDMGMVKTDDTGRPKLKLKLHDWQIGGFRSIAMRYGSDALEVIEARKFQKHNSDVVTELEAQKLFA